MGAQSSFEFYGVRITPLAEYSIRARVLSTHRYWLGKPAEIMPVDLALGWQEMSDSAVLDKLNITQGGRFYFYTWKRSPPPLEEKNIILKSANMHLLSADGSIESQIKKLRPGHIVTLVGRLVRAEFPSGTTFNSSLVRTDTGAGSCEVMWVTSIQVEN